MKIVVRGTNWVGDAVMTIPALRQLRRIFADAHITLQTRAWAKDVFEAADFIDEILVIEENGGLLKSLKDQSRVWREKEFDLAVLLTNSFRTALLAKLGQATKRFGYRSEGRGLLLTNPIGVPKWKLTRHEVYYYLNLIAEIEDYFFDSRSSESVTPDSSLGVPDFRREEAKRMLNDSESPGSQGIVALGIGSRNSMAKRWDLKSYARLNDLVQSKLGHRVILPVSSAETEIAEAVADISLKRPEIFKTSLAEAMAVLSEVDLHVSNDMGLAHVSAAVGTKTLTIFGPTNPDTTCPWDSEVIRRDDVECSPCMLRDCPIDHRCMARISPEHVFQKAQILLNEPE